MADEARKVLSHLLSTVQDPKSRHHDKYANWLQSSPGIEDFIFSCLRPDVIRWIDAGKNSSVASLRAIGGDTDAQRRGVYLHGIVGLDRYTRKYIGQSNDLSVRIRRQHMNFRYRRDNASLHYFAVQRSSFDIFSILAVIPNLPNASTTLTNPSTNPRHWDRTDLVLNILEMWTCLLFRSLPVASLTAYLPPGSPVSTGPPESLNIALPLDQGMDISERDAVDLRAVRDPLLREWLRLDEGEVVVADAGAGRGGYAGRGRGGHAGGGQQRAHGEAVGNAFSPGVVLGVGFAVFALFVIFSPRKR